MAIAGLHDKAVMDAESQAADLQAKKTRMKHMGEFKETGTPVVIVFRTLPNDSESCPRLILLLTSICHSLSWAWSQPWLSIRSLFVSAKMCGTDHSSLNILTVFESPGISTTPSKYLEFKQNLLYREKSVRRKL